MIPKKTSLHKEMIFIFSCYLLYAPHKTKWTPRWHDEIKTSVFVSVKSPSFFRSFIALLEGLRIGIRRNSPLVDSIGFNHIYIIFVQKMQIYQWIL